ncbi:MAG: hypothetical protein JWO22_738 [Frankiales bacterium]|nr:hypothetical protein [Frankiales bacterium]
MTFEEFVDAYGTHLPGGEVLLTQDTAVELTKALAQGGHLSRFDAAGPQSSLFRRLSAAHPNRSGCQSVYTVTAPLVHTPTGLSNVRMLELRPSCERCDVDLPPESEQARICTYECTFCAACVEAMAGVCPNCGGNFASRPIRPAARLPVNPASTTRVFNPDLMA